MTGWNIDVPRTDYYGIDPRTGRDAHTADQFQTLINELSDNYHHQVIAIDTETTGLDTSPVWRPDLQEYQASLPLYFSLAWGSKRATLHASLLPSFTPFFQDPYKWWVMANAKYDTHILANMNCHISGSLIDTCVMHALLYEDKPHGLKFMCKQLAGWSWGDFQDQFGKIGATQSAEQLIQRAEREDFDRLKEYASNDALGTMMVFNILREQLQKAGTHALFRDGPMGVETLWDLFHKIEVPYTKTLWRMERHGIKVNRERLEKARPQAEAFIAKLESRLVQLRGGRVNVNSTKQMCEWLVDQRGLKPLKHTKGGKTGKRGPSVDAGFLKHYADEGDEACELLLQHREYSKLLGTYINGLHKLLDKSDRIHTRYNQDVARTGRLSSSGPNLQNIPRPENDHWDLRGAFVPEKGYTMLCFDYGQLEMRLLAEAAQDADMTAMINSGRDIHMGNAAMVFGLAYEDIVEAKKKKEAGEALTPHDKACLTARASVKEIGFGILYGMGPAKLANSLGIPQAEAEAKILQFLNSYPAVKAFTDEAVAETLETGYAFTLLGRRRNIPEIASRNRKDRSRGERLAVNCVDMETEALTRRGWVRGDTITLDDELLSYNMHDGTLSWEHPTDIKLYPEYDGPLTAIENKTFSALTTPNHRWAAYSKSAHVVKERTTETLSRWGDDRIVRTGRLVGGGAEHVDDRLQLAGWFLTDGFICKRHVGRQRVGLCQSLRAKQANVEEIDALLARLGIKACRTVNKSECVYWYFIGEQADWLYETFPQRELTPAFVSFLDVSQASLLMRIMLKGDGNYYKKQNLTTFCCGRAATVDAFQMLAVLAGYATTARYRDMSMYTPVSEKMHNIPKSKGCYYVTVLQRHTVQVQHAHVTENIAGQAVWCPVVPNTFFVARRNGKVYITGNTQIQGSAADIVKMAQVIYDKLGFERLYGCRMLLQVHDELVFECPDEHVELMCREIQDVMRWPLPKALKVNLDVDGGPGQSWGEAK